jgi:hypothetical protein
MTGNPRAGCDGVYLRADKDVNDAPHATNATSGNELFFHATLGRWFISGSTADAETGASFTNIACDSATTCVPEGTQQWRWIDAAVADFQTAPVTITFVPEANARRQLDVRCPTFWLCFLDIFSYIYRVLF